MVVDLKYVVYIIAGIIAISTAIITFFQMQTRQNMKIESLECRMDKVDKKISEQSHYQIETEKVVVEINTKLTHIMSAVDELKKQKGQI